MTSDEIKQKSGLDMSSSAWLREIAMQLALLNEIMFRSEPKPNIPQKRR